MTINSAKAYRVMMAVKGVAREVSEHASKAAAVEAMGNVPNPTGPVAVANQDGRIVAHSVARSV